MGGDFGEIQKTRANRNLTPINFQLTLNIVKLEKKFNNHGIKKKTN